MSPTNAPKPKPTTVAAYLAEQPPERREALAAIRKTIKANLPEGYAEGIQYGMIGYFVPHSVYPKGYHCDAKQPVPFMSLASQKQHMAVYLFCLYCNADDLATFQATWEADTGRLDMGKSCVRFRNLDDVSLKAIAEAVRATPVEKFIASYEAAWVTPREDRAKAAKAASKKAASKKAASKKAVTKKAVTKKAVAKKTTKKASKGAAKKSAGKKSPRRDAE